MGITLSVAVTVSLFRALTPNEVFPVTYRRAKTASTWVVAAEKRSARRSTTSSASR